MKLILFATVALQICSNFSAHAARGCNESQTTKVCNDFYDGPPACNMKKDHKCTCENDGGGPSVGGGTYCRTAGGIMRTGGRPSKVDSKPVYQ